MVLRDQDAQSRNFYKHIRLFIRPDQLGKKVNVLARQEEDDSRSLASILDSSPLVKKRGTSSNEKYLPCVSFNTVPRSRVSSPLDEEKREFPGVQVPADYTMDEYYDDESGYSSDSNVDFFSRNSYSGGSSNREGSSASPGRYSSPPPASRRNIKIGQMFKISGNGKIVREDYPTTPTDINDALVINRAYANWRELWIKKKNQIDRRLEQKQDFFNYPTILFPPNKKKISAGAATTIKFNPPLEDGFTPLTKSQKRKERVLNEVVGFPNTPRTILCHVSGRRHTWVALDWALRTLIQNTDHIVVLANLPGLTRSNFDDNGSMTRRKRLLMTLDDSRSIRSTTRSRSRSRSRSVCTRRALSLGPEESDNKMKHESFMEWSSGYTQNEIERKLQDLFDYVTLVLPQDRSVKITVEILIGKTKKTLLEAINIYFPDFFVSSTLRWKRTDNLVRWKSNLLTDKLCTNFPIPTFVVPAKRMLELELNLQRQFTDSKATKEKDKSASKPGLNHSKSADARLPTISSIKREPINDYSIDSLCYSADSNGVDDESRMNVSNGGPNTSDNDENDVGSVKSLTSNISVKERLCGLARNRRESMAQQLNDADHDSSIPPGQRHLKKLDIILESSLKFSLEVDTITDSTENADANGSRSRSMDSGFEELKRVITGGAPPKHVAAQKRSMLDVLDNPSASRSKSKSRSRSKSRTRDNPKPGSPSAADINSDTSESRSRSPQIKFASTVKDVDGNAALGVFKSKLSPDNTGDKEHHHSYYRGADQPATPAFPELTPSKSYSVSSGNKDPSLRKVSSASSLRKVKSNDFSPGKHTKKTPVTSTYLKPNSGGGGLFSFFKSKSRSSSPLRSGTEAKSTSKRSGLFGFRKL
ncbi:hypothetical protein SKDZ_04G6660 [Saccharomyces kudriavzevii ZP591]|nr:hypothetical protein SKDZ_04G6660 [Saccharomyces kudriavzevii ZP591]